MRLIDYVNYSHSNDRTVRVNSTYSEFGAGIALSRRLFMVSEAILFKKKLQIRSLSLFRNTRRRYKRTCGFNQVDSRTLLLGVSPQNVVLLSELPEHKTSQGEETEAKISFSEVTKDILRSS